MKTWKNAEIVELNIRATFQNHQGIDGDNWVKGEPMPEIVTNGDDYNESGATTTATVHDN